MYINASVVYKNAATITLIHLLLSGKNSIAILHSAMYQTLPITYLTVYSGRNSIHSASSRNSIHSAIRKTITYFLVGIAYTALYVKR